MVASLVETSSVSWNVRWNTYQVACRVGVKCVVGIKKKTSEFRVCWTFFGKFRLHDAKKTRRQLHLEQQRLKN